MIDTHCHLQFRAYEADREAVIKRCEEKKLIANVVGTQINTSKAAVELASRLPWVYATIGLHPIHEHAADVEEETDSFKARAEKFSEKKYEEIILGSGGEKVIAIGETGLDFFHMPKDFDPEQVQHDQKQVFLFHAALAMKHNLPLVMHVRNAHQKMIDLLKTMKTRPNGVIHCFTGDWETAEQYLNLGFYIGFTGVITFPPKKTSPREQETLLEAVKKTPLEKILIETDAPYLAPQLFRGQRCEPWMVEETAKKIAEIKGISVDKMVEITDKNALNLFTKISRAG